MTLLKELSKGSDVNYVIPIAHYCQALLQGDTHAHTHTCTLSLQLLCAEGTIISMLKMRKRRHRKFVFKNPDEQTSVVI